MRKFEIFKSKNQKNKLNNSTFKLIPKISVKFQTWGLWLFDLFAVSNCEQHAPHKQVKIAVRSYFVFFDLFAISNCEQSQTLGLNFTLTFSISLKVRLFDSFFWVFDLKISNFLNLINSLISRFKTKPIIPTTTLTLARDSYLVRRSENKFFLLS